MEVRDASFLHPSLAYGKQLLVPCNISLRLINAVCGTTDNTRKRTLIPNFLEVNKRPKTLESTISSATSKRKLHEADGPQLIKRICLSPSLSSPSTKRKHDNTMDTAEQRDRIPSNIPSKKSREDAILQIRQEVQKDNYELLKPYNDYNWWKADLPSLEDEMDN